MKAARRRRMPNYPAGAPPRWSRRRGAGGGRARGAGRRWRQCRAGHPPAVPAAPAPGRLPTVASRRRPRERHGDGAMRRPRERPPGRPAAACSSKAPRRRAGRGPRRVGCAVPSRSRAISAATCSRARSPAPTRPSSSPATASSIWRCGPRRAAYGDGFAEARVRYGLQGDRTQGTVVELREAYVNAYLGPIDLRLGQQIIVWGRADALNPTNNLTPVDFRIRSPLEDDIRLGNAGARAFLRFAPFRLEGVWMPIYLPTELPAVALPPYVSYGRAGLPVAGSQDGIEGVRLHLELASHRDVRVVSPRVGAAARADADRPDADRRCRRQSGRPRRRRCWCRGRPMTNRCWGSISRRRSVRW